MDWFELFDGSCPEDLPLDESPIDMDNVLAIVREDMGWAKEPRRLGRMVRMGLVAAALIAALGVTAFAVYEIFIDRYVIDQPFDFETDEEAEERTTTRVSLTGYQGTPEYQAYTEWEAWQRGWLEKTMEVNPWQARGVDDSWYETPDNYALLYSACFQEQADALDDIVDKYGLTLHQDMAVYYLSKDLYEALGTEPFLLGDIDPISENYDVGGYIYDDGSFKAEFNEKLSGDRTVSMSMFVNAKGSFAEISGFLELSEDGEAWQYETASGETVDLYLYPSDAMIMGESEGAYLYVGMYAGSASTDSEVERDHENLPLTITREDLEAIADSIDFAVLADRFDGTDHPETAEMLPVLKEREEVRFAPARATAGINELSDDIIARLGRYAPSVLPETFADILTEHEEPLDPDRIGLEGTAQFARGVDTANVARVDSFEYYRITDSPTEPAAYVSTIREWLAEKYPDGEITDETVQGRPAAMVLMPDHGAVYWYDEDVDLLFVMSRDDMRESPAVDRDAVLAMAESVERKG